MWDKKSAANNDTTPFLLELASDIQSAIVVEDERNKIVLANQLFCDLFGITIPADKLTGIDISSLTDTIQNAIDHRENVNPLLYPSDNRKKELNKKLVLKNSKAVLYDYNPVFSNNVYKGSIRKFTDITNQVTVTEELSKQKRFYEQILNNIPADIAVFNKQHEYIFLNPVAVKEEELRKWLIGKTDFDYCTYKNRPLSLAESRGEVFNKVIHGKIQIEREEQLIAPDGQTEYHLRKLFPVLDEDGEVNIVIGYGMNITERKKAEQDIKISEARFREIFNYSLAMICTHNLEGTILSVNPSANKILGYTADELIGNPLDMIISEKYRNDFWQHYLNEILTTGESKGVMNVSTKSGYTKYLLYENHLVPNEHGTPYVVGSAQDITERISTQRELRKSEEKYRNIIDNMNLGLIEIDANRKIVYSNERFLQMTGYERKEVVNHPTTSLEIFDQNKVKEKFELRKRGISDAYEMQAHDKAGEEKWWLISGTPLLSNNGEFAGTIGIFLDITKQKQQEEELKKARKKAEDAGQAKEMFLANMSHEIRTPMNAIIGISKLMQKTQLDEQQKFYLNAIQTASDNLLIVINDILDFTKIEAGKIELENIGFDLTALVKHTLYILKPKADEKNIDLKMSVDTNIKKVLIGDPYRLNQVIMNILTNAIKFTDNGGVEIVCTMANEKNNKQEILIQITDTGIGMSETFLQQLFNKFSQEDETITRRFGGTGLGMSISKQLVDLMNGTITVNSQKDKGTNFNINLEFVIGTDTDLPKKQKNKVNAPEIKDKKILVADDNKLNRIVATTIIKQYGGIPDEVDNGVSAIEKVLNTNYDLVLMDVQMPEKDGIEATKEIRDNSAFKNLPIIALTASATSGEKEKCIDAGMNDFISKPFEESAFIHTMAQWLQSSEDVQFTIPTEKLYNLEKLKMLSGESNDFLLKYLQLFVDEISPLIDQTQTALENKDYKLIAALIHHIKPSLLDMGITILNDDISKIEKSAVANDADNTLKLLLQKVACIIKQITDDIEKQYGIKGTV